MKFADSVDVGMGASDVTDGGESQPVKWNLGTMNPINWTFLNEPAWKWAAFFIASSMFLVAWKGALRYMK